MIFAISTQVPAKSKSKFKFNLVCICHQSYTLVVEIRKFQTSLIIVSSSESANYSWSALSNGGWKPNGETETLARKFHSLVWASLARTVDTIFKISPGKLVPSEAQVVGNSTKGAGGGLSKIEPNALVLIDFQQTNLKKLEYGEYGKIWKPYTVSSAPKAVQGHYDCLASICWGNFRVLKIHGSKWIL